jgi:hypothetical protein
MAEDRRQRLGRLIDPFRVAPGTTVNLPEDHDPAYTAGG